MFQGNKNELWIKERVSINIFFTVMQRFKKGKNASFFWIITHKPMDGFSSNIYKIVPWYPQKL